MCVFWTLRARSGCGALEYGTSRSDRECARIGNADRRNIFVLYAEGSIRRTRVYSTSSALHVLLHAAYRSDERYTSRSQAHCFVLSQVRLTYLVCTLLTSTLPPKRLEAKLPAQDDLRMYYESDTIDVTSFGAVVDDGQDDVDAFRRAIAIQQTKGGILHVPPGRFNFSTTLYQGELTRDLIIVGSRGAILECQTRWLELRSPIRLQRALTQDAYRGDSLVVFVDTALVRKGDLISVRSSTSTESNWNYPESDCHWVSQVLPEGVALATPLNFAYTPETESTLVTVSEPRRVFLCSLGIELRGTDEAQNWVRLDRVAATLSDLRVSGSGKASEGELISFYDCADVTLDHILLSDGGYGVLINNSRDVRIRDLEAYRLIHPVVPATWSDEVSVTKLRGEDFGLDAHPSFNVTYQDVDADLHDNYFNARAVGISFRKVRLRSKRKAASGKIYIGVLGLSEEVSAHLHEYNTSFEDVYWLHEYAPFNGLSFNSGHNITVRRCTTHQVFFERGCRNILIEDSHLGQLNANLGSLQIRNTTFDNSLLRGEVNGGVLNFSWSGTVRVDGCTFLNYGRKQPLIGYLNDPNLSRIELANSDLRGVSILVGNTRDRSNLYTGVSVYNSTFSRTLEREMEQWARPTR